METNPALAANLTERPANQDVEQLAAELTSTRRRLQAALGTAQMAYWDWDAVNDRLAGSRSLDDLYGLPEGERLTSQSRIIELIHPQDRVRHRDQVVQAAEQGEGWHAEFRIVRPRDGTIAWLEERASVTSDPRSGRRYTTGLVWDISARKRTEEALNRIRREGELSRQQQLERERHGREAAEALLAVMSHELRTPITSIRGTAALLGRNPQRADLADLVVDIQEESDRLMRMIDDLMVLSGVERGLLRLNPEPVLLRHLVPPMVSELRRRFPQVDFRVELSQPTSAMVADSTALRQVLHNLLTNGAKYAGSHGPVTLSARDDQGEVEISVRDHGPGLGDNPDVLFDLFYRDPELGSHTSGTGIGLYVVRELVAAMGTSIRTASPADGGAMFSFRLPAVTDMEA